MKKTLLVPFMLLFSCAVFAQTQISGRVTSDSGVALQGVTVTVKNTKIVTTTDADGNFTTNIPSGKTLLFTSVGYQNIEVSSLKSPLNVSMTPVASSLTDVVVVGYGTRSRRDITGSVAKVTAKDITNTPVTSFETAIQGRASGVFVQQQNGKLGQGINIRIRGASSVSAGNEPLYVVDGIPVISSDLSNTSAPTDALSDLNMNDIASIDILKDASATAIYGSQGSNGVVLITTKKGRAGSSRVEANYFTGFQKPTRKREFLDARQFIDYFELAAIGAGKQDFLTQDPNDPIYSTVEEAIADEKAYVESRFNRYAGGDTSWKTGRINTNWQDQIYQDAPISQYDLSFSGGSEKTKYYASGQYLDQKGILIANSYKRYNARLNIDQQAKDWLNFGMNMSFARSENNRLSDDNAFSTPLQIIALSPITPLIDPRTGLTSGALDPNTGNPNTNFPVYYNPLLSVGNQFYKTMVNRTLGNVYGNVHFTKSLSLRSELGIDQLNQTEEAYYGRLTARNTSVPDGSGLYNTTQVLNLTTNNYFNYTNTFGELHNVDVTGGIAFQKSTNDFSLASAQGFPSDAYKKLNAGATKTDASSGTTTNTLLSYFLRANYKFSDKYLLALSGRIDGSSRFGKNNRYGFFPAASAGWILSQERFLSRYKWLSLLKLKASYGANGNDRIPDFASRALYSGTGAYGGEPGQLPTQLANPDLKWETTLGADVGVEFGLFNRINVEVDLYQRNTKDLLLSQQVPGTSGFSTQYSNIGKLNNKGIEVSINTSNINTPAFRWTTNINFSANKNKVTDLGGQLLGTSVNKAMEGQPLGVFVAREFAVADPANGDALYYKNTPKTDGSTDRATTNDYNAAADVVIGNPNPKFFYGLDNTFNYKGVELEVLLQGVYGNKVFNGGGQYMSASGSNGFDNQTLDQLNAWQKPGDITNVPEARLFYANGTDNSSRYISTGSYMRVKSVSLGYNLPADVVKKMKLERLRVYVRAVNLFTATKYTGWDPEVNADYQVSNINQGVDFYSAPQIKSIVFGISLGL